MSHYLLLYYNRPPKLVYGSQVPPKRGRLLHFFIFLFKLNRQHRLTRKSNCANFIFFNIPPATIKANHQGFKNSKWGVTHHNRKAGAPYLSVCVYAWKHNRQITSSSVPSPFFSKHIGRRLTWVTGLVSCYILPAHILQYTPPPFFDAENYTQLHLSFFHNIERERKKEKARRMCDDVLPGFYPSLWGGQDERAR